MGAAELLFSSFVACSSWHCPGWQDEYMVSNKDLKEKYQTAEEFEDDFM